MKGQTKVQIGEKEVSLRFDLNALDSFCEKADCGLSELDKALDTPKNIKLFVQCLAESGGSKVSTEEIGALGFSELNAVFELVKSSAGNLNAPQKGSN